MKWSIKNESCLSCNTTIKPHKSKGYCTKCYPVKKEIEKLEKASEKELDDFRIKYISPPYIPCLCTQILNKKLTSQS